MLSRISIDVNEDNQPVVVIDYKASGDVRDKLVKKFLEGFGGGRWAQVQFKSHSQGDQTLEIQPLGCTELEEHSKTMKAFVDFHNR